MDVPWDPDRYLAYADERGRPFADLVARIDARAPARVVDLGCGPGNLTALLSGRWPHAAVHGVDADAAMIASATERGEDRITFEQADLRAWLARGDRADVLVANAVLQWLPEHLDLLPALVAAVRPEGWLAFQVPANFGEPSHTIRTELAGRPEYAAHVASAPVPSSHAARDYLTALRATGAAVEVWETTYLHVLSGADPVFAWVAGTGARPTLESLPADLRAGFESEFKHRLREAYPDDGTGVVLPFRRIFAVAHRGAA